MEVRRNRRTLPAGSVFVTYAAADRQESRQAPIREAATVEAIRFAVTGNTPLLSTRGVLLADEAHRVAGRVLASRNIDDAQRRDLLGTGRATSGHRHAHWIPVAGNEQRGAAVGSLVLWAPGQLRSSEVAAVIDLRVLSGKRSRQGNGDGYEVDGFPEVRLLFQAAGPVEQVAPELCGPARSWRSLTPYLPVRHRKREPLADYLTADIRAELSYRDHLKDLPVPAVTPIEADGRLPDRWSSEFRRYRMTERLSQSRPGLGLRLDFADEIGGPLLLGQLSHFGYGIFVPEPR